MYLRFHVRQKFDKCVPYIFCRENSFSPEFEDFEFSMKKFDEDIDASDDSGHGRSTEMSGPHSLSSSAPRLELGIVGSYVR